MKNLRNSRKALSPVVASIILIAVTVAVSIAVAAWMGALTTGFMATEELKITRMKFEVDNNDKTIVVIANNTGTTPVTISAVYLNNEDVTDDVTFTPTTGTAAANSGLVIDIDYTWQEGNNYQVKLISSKGNTFVYTAVGPE
ncbi:MAG: archaellin/type IV pilin N-terminal domain-containing protein [Candidatus Bathyarchaeales archaeon]